MTETFLNFNVYCKVVLVIEFVYIQSDTSEAHGHGRIIKGHQKEIIIYKQTNLSFKET